MPGKPKPKSKPKAPAKRKASSSASSSRTSKPSKASKPIPRTAKATPAPAGDDWRARTIDEVRRLIQQADPDAVEEVKWRKPSNAMQGVATWSHDGLICTGETYKDKVKFTFARGAALDDPAGLFNADDKGSTRRAIDLREGEMVEPDAFKSLVQAAVDANAAKASAAKTR